MESSVASRHGHENPSIPLRCIAAMGWDLLGLVGRRVPKQMKHRESGNDVTPS